MPQFERPAVVEKSRTKRTHSQAMCPICHNTLAQEQIVKEQTSRSQLPQKINQDYAEDALWNGNFTVQFDCGELELYQMQAHPPMPLGRGKILKLCKEMSAVLQFQSIPLEDVWSRTTRKIDLYFFPRVECIGYDMLVNAKNSALRARIRSNIELLVFTSKLLPAHIQSINNQNFLWGVFRQLKHKGVSER